ncbi:MAG TPA: DUF1592 domain-containing protein, partial [Humisphaera sp.]
MATPARPAGPITTASLEARFNAQVKPLLAKHCTACHNATKHKGDLSLDPYQTLASVQNGREKWLHIAEVMKQKLMPPEEKPQPTQAEFDLLITWIVDAVEFCDCSGPRDPGRVSIHRLNRTEYNNTIRDLLGVDFKPAKDFPADDTGYGFDNIADVLTMSPLLAEKYLAAAEQVMERVAPSGGPAARPTKLVQNDLKASGAAGNAPGLLVGKGDNSFAYDFVADGQYDLKLNASYQRKVGEENAKVEVRVDGRPVGTVEVAWTRDKQAVAKLRFAAKAGKRTVSLSLTNPATADNPRRPGQKMARSVSFEVVEVMGPYNAAPPPPSPAYKKVFIASPGPGVTEDVAARTNLQQFLRRAYRRPPMPDEVESLFKLYKATRADGESFEGAVRLCCTAVLASPHFLFRVEVDPTSVVGGDPNKPVPYAIGDYELASRLSYFLWSSMPDDELLGAAGTRKLRDPKGLEEQVMRMLADPRASALVENFIGQWLELRNLDDYAPDKQAYPQWDDALKSAMKRETELLFGAIVKEDRSVLELLTADYTYLNERLAKHYGIPNVAGEQFRKVSLAGTKRGGLLTQASILTVTAMPTRTSPVKRGKFILENVLGTPPPPPPPDVAPLKDSAADVSKATLKQRLEAHRADPNCAVCHIRMDAIGFSLENYDAIGAWREKDGPFPIDASGKLPDGSTIAGADGLKKMLVGRQADFL